MVVLVPNQQVPDFLEIILINLRLPAEVCLGMLEQMKRRPVAVAVSSGMRMRPRRIKAALLGVARSQLVDLCLARRQRQMLEEDFLDQRMHLGAQLLEEVSLEEPQEHLERASLAERTRSQVMRLLKAEVSLELLHQDQEAEACSEGLQHQVEDCLAEQHQVQGLDSAEEHHSSEELQNHSLHLQVVLFSIIAKTYSPSLQLQPTPPKKSLNMATMKVMACMLSQMSHHL